MRQSSSPVRALGRALAALAIGSGTSTVAMAQTNVSVTGRLTAGTCEWGVGGGDQTVTLDTIHLSQLKLGQVAGLKTFSLSLTNCSAGMVSATFTFSGTPDSTDTLRYRNTGSATGVAIELQSSDGKTIGADGTDNRRTAIVTSGQVSLPLQVGYWRVAARATTGTVRSSATFTIAYN